MDTGLTVSNIMFSEHNSYERGGYSLLHPFSDHDLMNAGVTVSYIMFSEHNLMNAGVPTVLYG